jgi:hypothetical protein
MNKSWIRRALSGMAALAAVLAPTLSYGALLVNYRFETVDGAVPNQTTPDSSGNFASTAGTINALLGFGTTPGTNYPQQMAGPVQNATVQSLNPTSAMQFFSTGGNTSHTRVEIANGSAGALNASFTNFSVALWLNPAAHDGGTAIGKMGNNGQRGWNISVTSTGGLSLDYFSTGSNGSDRNFLIAGALPLSTWTHVAFTFNGNTGFKSEAIYINGVAQALTNTGPQLTIPDVLWSNNTAPFKVGHRGGNQTSVRGWNGGIDDVRIYNETLDAAQVQALMTQVPEPRGIALAVIGAVSAIACFRRTRKSRS